MSFAHNHAGLNITGRKLQLVEVVHKEDGLFLENVDEELFGEKLDFSGKETRFISILQNSFNQIIQRKALKSVDVSFALPSDLFRIIRLPYEPTLTNKDLAEHFKWELSILFPPLSPNDFIIQYIEVEKSDLTKEKEVILIAARKSYVNALHKFTQRNKLRLRYVDYAHIASTSFIHYDNLANENAIFCSFYLDGEDISIIVLDAGAPVYINMIKAESSTDFVILLAKEFEKMQKLNINPRMIAKFYYCGIIPGENKMKQIEKEFGIQIKRINPFHSFKIDGSIAFTRYYQNENYSFTPAAGIALRMT